MLGGLRARSRRKRMAARLFACVSARAREPVFFDRFGVADTFDGRFDLLALHAWLVLDRLRNAGEGALAQALVDVLFMRLDEALREQGTGDMGMGRRMKKMASAFYGRLDAYSGAKGSAEFAQALLRNLYRGDTRRVEDAASLATYAEGARIRLELFRPDAGDPDFGELPAMEKHHDARPSRHSPA